MSDAARPAPVPHGAQLIGGERVRGGGAAWRARAAADGAELPGEFRDGTVGDVDRAARLAEAAADAWGASAPATRACMLERAAERIEALGDALVLRCMAETGYAEARVRAERARTLTQVRMFARIAAEDAWADAAHDAALPERAPQPRPDLRLRNVPIGPVAVLGAANFPLALSVAGCDALGALAVGCPALIKAHPAHPGTCEMVGEALVAAVADVGAPAGTVALLQGRDHEVGAALAAHPAVQALAFTGSQRGGLALAAIAARRPTPIPVFAEMGSLNPVLPLPRALAARGAAIAAGLAQSATLGCGQFCTRPGLVIGIAGAPWEAFVAAVAAAVARAPAAPMLHAGIAETFADAVRSQASLPGLRVLASGVAGAPGWGVPVALACDAAAWLAAPALREEVFGPALLLVACRDAAERDAVVAGLAGQLTATVWAEPGELRAEAPLLRRLGRVAGRVIVNGLPTGVEVCEAMQHGGPFPATLDPRWTSIGTRAWRRFVRPLCLQGWPADELPAGWGG